MSLFSDNPIIPVLSIDDVDTARYAVTAMQTGGIECIEVALRTPNALSVLEALVDGFPELVIGAGTVRRVGDFAKIQAAGAEFAVSPGTTQELLEESKRWDIPYLPAASTVSEVMVLMDNEIELIKLFPAQTLGGIKFLSDLSGPLPDARFVPSGGVNLDNYKSYLELSNVVSVSGTWMLASDLVAAKAWDEITRICQKTLEPFLQKS